jgi:FMN phosphatase YigB (HAD superfamily)
LARATFGTVFPKRPQGCGEEDMSLGAVTFDFHNTLATCDPWFQLEVRSLVRAFLLWDAGRTGRPYRPETLTAGDRAYRRLRLAIHDHGHELPAERCVALVLDGLGIRASDDHIRHGIDAIMSEALADTRPVTGAIETVRALAGAGIPLGIVSSAVHHSFLEWTLERFGIRSAFAIVTTSASSGYYKSRPEIFWHTLERLGALPEYSVHVGDSLRFDVGGAHRAGMRTVHLQTASEDRRHDGAPRPDLVVSQLRDSIPAILRLLGHGLTTPAAAAAISP